MTFDAYSFSTRPPDSGNKPAKGNRNPVTSLGPIPYNVIAAYSAGSESALGRAIQDESGNNFYIENNGGYSIYIAKNPGVFLKSFADVFEQSTTDGPDNFARFLAAVIAHEIGHSLGLNHDDGDTHIMNTSYSFNPAITWSFRASDISRLNLVMPGPGRN